MPNRQGKRRGLATFTDALGRKSYVCQRNSDENTCGMALGLYLTKKLSLLYPRNLVI